MSGSRRLTELADQDVTEGPEVGRQLLGADPFQHLSQKQESHLKIQVLSKVKVELSFAFCNPAFSQNYYLTKDRQSC